MVREILVDWQTINGGGKVGVFYFDDVLAVGAQRAALGAYLNSVKAIQHSTTSYTVRTSGKDMSTATGTLTASWNDAATFTGVGGIAAGQVCADATQALQRWFTASIISGRFLRGRTFLPGIAQGALVNGNLGPTSVTLLTTSGNTLGAAPAGFGVWHRPQGGSGGIFSTVTGAGGWSEMAVLRRRRG